MQRRKTRFACVVIGAAAMLAACEGEAPKPLKGEIAKTQIVFATSGYNASDVWIAHADGSNLRKLRSDAHSRVKLSPDGKLIAFKAGADNMHVVTDLGGSILHQFEGCHRSEDFSWTPDGNAILFGCYVDGLWRYDLTDSSLTRFYATGGYTYDHNPAMSPDLTKIAFTHHEYGSQYKIAVIDPDGGNPTVVAEGGGTYHDDCLNLIWLDDTHVIFNVSYSPRFEIHSVDLETNTDTKIDVSVPFTEMALRFDKKVLALFGGGGIYFADAGPPPGNIRRTKAEGDSGDFAWSRKGRYYVTTGEIWDPTEPENHSVMRIFSMTGKEYKFLTQGMFPNKDVWYFDVFSMDWSVADERADR
jgi:Tol biopolymer transport system component